MSIDPGTLLPATTDALIRHLRRTRLQRTLLVASVSGAGRELLRTVARAEGGWSGLEATTLRPLAIELASPALAAAGVSVLDEFQEEALIERVIDEAVEGDDAGPYAQLAGGPGFRRSVRGAVAALGSARVSPEELARVSFAVPSKRAFLVDVLRRFNTAAAHRRLVPVSEVYRLAAEALQGGRALRTDHILLLPGQSTRGVSGELIGALLARGAVLLPADPVFGLERPEGVLWKGGPEVSELGRLHAVPAQDPGSAPGAWSDLPLFAETETDTPGASKRPRADAVRQRSFDATPEVSLFCASGIHEELTEVLRRISADAIPWEEVEIVAADPAVYGPALHAIASRHGIDVTFATGLPVARTRPGNALASYFRWIREDFPATILHRLLIRGDLRTDPPVDPARLARRLRRLRIGWGRERYLPAIDGALRRLDTGQATEGADAGGNDRRREREELEALRSLIAALVETAPREIPGRMAPRPRPVSPAALARGVVGFLSLVATASEVDETARDRLLRALDRISSELLRPSSFRTALASLEDHLEIRVPAPRAEGRAPWLSDGGSLHFADLEHGGASGRANTFLVGFDASRFPGPVGQDPMLLDRERRAISRELPTSTDRRQDLEFRVAALLARLRGRVTLSYPVWDAQTAQALAPSPLLLQAFRQRDGDPLAGFGKLRESIGAPAGRIPRGADVCLGVEESWLAELAGGEGFLDGRRRVCEGFEKLGRGVEGREAWNPAMPPGNRTGLVEPGSLTALADTPLSASRLEQLGTCPRRFFFASVLGISAPEEPEFRPDAWLDARARGGLLHRVFEQTLRIAREEDVASREELQRVGNAALRETARLAALELPPPSKAVMEREMRALAEDVRCFVSTLPPGGPPWTELELPFGGRDGADVGIEIGSSVIRLRGRIDRVDRNPDGSVTVIDYKTGAARAEDWSRRTGTYRGGRRLQHLLYALVLERMGYRPVASAEYHFPTLRGEGAVIAFPSHELRQGTRILELLVEAVTRGRFVPTDSVSDCRFCEFGPLCGVTGPDHQPSSRAAAFAQAHVERGTEDFELLASVRRFEGVE